MGFANMMNKKSDQLVSALFPKKEYSDQGETVMDIVKATKGKRTTVVRILKKMMEEGKIRLVMKRCGHNGRPVPAYVINEKENTKNTTRTNRDHR